MQKVLLTTAIAAALTFASVAAQAASKEGAFVGLQTGRTTTNIDHTQFDKKAATAAGITGGYRWKANESFYVGADTGYIDFGSIAATEQSRTYLVNGHYGVNRQRNTLRSHAFTLGGNILWSVAPDWSLSARAGLLYMQTDLTVRYAYTGTTGRIRSSATDNGIYAGVGGVYDISPNVSVSLNYDRYSVSPNGSLYSGRRVDSDVWGMAAEFRF